MCSGASNRLRTRQTSFRTFTQPESRKKYAHSRDSQNPQSAKKNCTHKKPYRGVFLVQACAKSSHFWGISAPLNCVISMHLNLPMPEKRTSSPYQQLLTSCNNWLLFCITYYHAAGMHSAIEIRNETYCTIIKERSRLSQIEFAQVKNIPHDY